jgi:hypothetical protein
MIDFKALEMADIEINSGPPNPAMDKAFSEFLKARRKEEDEMSAFRRAWDDFEVGPSKPLTSEDKRLISEALKAYREKEGRSNKARTIHSRDAAPAGKKAKAVAK